MPCEASVLAGIGLFEHLGADDCRDFAKLIDDRKLAAGALLFRAGDPGESLFVVRTGQLELYINDTAGQKIVLATVGQGEVFGELALLDQAARTATAVAVTDAELLEVRRDELLVLFRKSPESALRLLAGMSHMTRKADELLRTRVVRNVNEEVEVHTTAFQRVADWISVFSGSMAFLILNAVWFATWISINTLPLGIEPFDPYPFGLLTMIVSLEAIFLSCFVLISQTRQGEKDRVRSDIEYEVNIKAELEVAHLHEKTDRIYTEMLQRFVRMERQLANGGTPPPD